MNVKGKSVSILVADEGKEPRRVRDPEERERENLCGIIERIDKWKT